MKTTRILVTLALSAGCLLGHNVIAKETGRSAEYTKILQSTRAPELPVRAAQLVKQADPKEQEATTIAVVKAAVSVNAAAAPLVVGTISKTVPKMAPVAAATAVSLQPKQAESISRAAAAAAPSQAGQIVAAVCRAVPAEYRNAAVGASHGAPKASKEIIDAVASAMPNLKSSIDQSVTVYGGSAPSVAMVLDKPAAKVEPLPAPLVFAKPPSIGPPYKPLTTTPTNVNPSTSGNVPPGGRDYAEP